MTEHVPTRETYWTEDMEDSILTDADVQRFRQSVGRFLRGEFNGDLLAETDSPSLELILTESGDMMCVNLYIDTAAFNKTVKDDESTDEEPHYLRDLGHEWEHTEAHLLSEIVHGLELPEYTPELSSYTIGDVGFSCSDIHDGDEPTAVFVGYFAVPNLVKKLVGAKPDNSAA